MVLPEMDHLVHQGRENRGRGPRPEMGRIEGAFIGHFLRVAQAGEPLAREVALGSPVPLHGDEARRKLAAEQRAWKWS